MNRRYRLVERLAANDGEYIVLTNRGTRAFRIDCRALTKSDRLLFRDMAGNEIVTVQPAHLAEGDAVRIVGIDGAQLAVVRRSSLTPLRDQFSIDVLDSRTLEVRGNVGTHEYLIVGPGGKIAEVSKRWFRVRGSYGVEIAPGQDHVLILAAVQGIDLLMFKPRG